MQNFDPKRFDYSLNYFFSPEHKSVNTNIWNHTGQIKVCFFSLPHFFKILSSLKKDLILSCEDDVMYPCRCSGYPDHMETLNI